jgi:translation elongation factor EF-Tu-like GTPase
MLNPINIPKDIEAEIYFLTPEEGGRNKPAYDDYRPQFYYDGYDWDARHIYPDVGKASPGDTVRAYLGFLSPQEHYGKVYVGMEFLIREGGKTVGTGKVVKIIELEQSAKRSTNRQTL